MLSCAHHLVDVRHLLVLPPNADGQPLDGVDYLLSARVVELVDEVQVVRVELRLDPARPLHEHPVHVVRGGSHCDVAVAHHLLPGDHLSLPALRVVHDHRGEGHVEQGAQGTADVEHGRAAVVESEEQVDVLVEAHKADAGAEDGHEGGVDGPLAIAAVREGLPAGQHNGTRHGHGGAIVRADVVPDGGDLLAIVARVVDGELGGDAGHERLGHAVSHARSSRLWG